MFADLYDWSTRLGSSSENPKGAIYCNNFLCTNNRKPWFSKSFLERRAIVTFNRLRANHTSLNESLFRKDIIDSSYCSCSNTDQTADHIFWECPDLIDYRLDMLTELSKYDLPQPYTITNLLKNLTTNIGEILYCFISKADLKI